MGIGKSIEALALAAVYRHNWPCIIMCPTSLKLNWKDQVLMWLNELVAENEVIILKDKNTTIKSETKIVIVSYDLAKKNEVTLKI